MANPFIISGTLDLDAASTHAIPRPMAITTQSGTFVNVVTVAEALLRTCRGQESDFQREISKFDARRAKSRIRSWFRRLFFRARTDFTGAYISTRYLRLAQQFLVAQSLENFDLAIAEFDDEVTSGFLAMDRERESEGERILRWWPNELSPVLKARAIAQALDDVYGEQFTFAFKELYPGAVRVRLESGTAFPTAPASRNFRRPAYRPHTMNDFLSHLRHLRIFPEHGPLKVDVVLNDAVTSGILSSLGGSEGLLQAGVVCLGPIDFKRLHSRYNFRFAETTHVYQPEEVHPEEKPRDTSLRMTGIGTFFHVSARPEVIDVTGAVEMLKEADRQRLRIVIMPELTFDQSRHDLLRDRFLAERWKHLQVLVAGSVHLTDNTDSPRNRLFVYFANGGRPFLDPVSGHPGPASFFHDKVAWYGTRNQARSGTASIREVCFDYEEVTRPGVVRINLIGGQLIGWAVCKDIVARTVSEVFEALGLAYIFVSSLSPTTEDFLVKLAAHSVVNNSIVLMAATTGRQQASVIVTVPAEDMLLAIQNSPPRRRGSAASRPRGLRPFTLAPTGVSRRSLVKLVVDANREKPATYRILRI